MITVIIPVYNCKQYLKEAVYSVLGQAYKNIAVLLVDDGSKDGSGELCDKFANDNANVYVIHKENGGVSSARNTGIDYALNKLSVADGSYFAFLDADDLWVRGFLDEKVLDILDNHYDLVGFQSSFCNYHVNRRDVPNYMKEGLHTDINPGMCNNQTFAAMFYSAKVLRKNIRFVENLKYSEDKLFQIQCVYNSESMFLCNKLLYLYRYNPASAVHNRPFGIDYYTPMFKAYLNAEYQNSKECISDWGRGFVSWYIVDMIEEHYRHFGSTKALKKWMSESEEYLMYARQFGGSRACYALDCVENRKLRYIIKQYVHGVFLFVRNTVKGLPVIKTIVSYKRFPVVISEEVL